MRDLPRWVRLGVVGIWTACAVALTVAGVLRLRWDWSQENGILLDTWRGAFCSLEQNACVTLPETVLERRSPASPGQ